MMSEDDVKQITWDLLLVTRRLNGDKHQSLTDDPRHEAIVKLHSEALNRFGRDGFKA